MHNDDIERVGEQGLNNNSLYSSFVEVGSSAEKLRPKKVKPERSKSSRRVVTRSRSLVVRRSSTMVSPSKSASQDDSSERRSHSRFRGLISCFVSCQHLADPFVLMPCQRLSKSVSDESIPSGPVREFLHQGRRVVHQTQVLSDILGLAEAGFHLLSFVPWVCRTIGHHRV